MTRCIRCLNDSTVSKISFNEKGLCSICQFYDKYSKELNDYKRLEEIFINKVTRPDDSYDYDCALGFSGGKDSTYVLSKLVKEYKLKVYAFTLDNGFLSDEAKDKIDYIIKKMSKDYPNLTHEYVSCDMVLLQKMYHYTIKKLLSPCLCCSILGYAVMINMSAKKNCYCTIHGRSTYQMFRTLSINEDDIFKDFVLEGLKPKTEDLNRFYDTCLNKIYSYIDKSIALEIKENLLSESYKNGFREFVAYFLYHPYNKDEIYSYIKENDLWDFFNKTEHFDCLIHNAASYLKNIVATRSHILPEVSVSVRLGHITKTEGKQILEKDSKMKYPKDEFKLMCKYAKLNKTYILLKAKVVRKIKLCKQK